MGLFESDFSIQATGHLLPPILYSFWDSDHLVTFAIKFPVSLVISTRSIVDGVLDNHGCQNVDQGG